MNTTGGGDQNQNANDNRSLEDKIQDGSIFPEDLDKPIEDLIFEKARPFIPPQPFLVKDEKVIIKDAINTRARPFIEAIQSNEEMTIFTLSGKVKETGQNQVDKMFEGNPVKLKLGKDFVNIHVKHLETLVQNSPGARTLQDARDRWGKEQ